LQADSQDTPVRIALITQYFNVIGGIESLLRGLIPEYERRGHETDVIVTREEAAAGTTVALGDKTRELFLPLHTYQAPARWALMYLPDTLRLANYLRKAKIDVAHSHLFDWSLLPQVVAACEITRTPLVHTWHSDTDFNSRARRLMVRVLRSADALTGVSAATRHGFDRILPAAKDALVISNGIDVEAAQKAAPYQHGRPYIFCACRLTLPDKAVDALITSFGAIAESHPNVDLLIAGEGPSRDAISRHISSLGLDRRVKLLGKADAAQIRSFNRGALFFAMPSRIVEGQPVALLEALAAGRAAIGTNIGGVPEVISHGENGLLVEKDDLPALTDALTTLLDNPGLSEAMGRRGLLRAREQYEISRTAERYLELYKLVRARRKLPSSAPKSADSPA
jgi:glycosyltransferase involved in cell wall biosynthesis